MKFRCFRDTPAGHWPRHITPTLVFGSNTWWPKTHPFQPKRMLQICWWDFTIHLEWNT